MITKQQYVEYLICTIGNHTAPHMAEHLDDVSHDVISDYLSSERRVLANRRTASRTQAVDWN
jgi:hypothetical protein